MDRGTWIAIIAFLFCVGGLIVITDIESGGTPSPTPEAVNIPAPTQPSTPSATQPTTQNTALLPDTNSQDCQSIATVAAQNNQTTQGNTTSVVQSYFNQNTQQCYYELDIFTDSGNETDLRIAPNDQVIASCATTATNTLSCQKPDGTTITEPQFKALLANDIPSQ